MTQSLVPTSDSQNVFNVVSMGLLFIDFDSLVLLMLSLLHSHEAFRRSPSLSDLSIPTHPITWYMI